MRLTHRFAPWPMVLSFAALTACSHTATYNASHFQYAPATVPAKVPGVAAIEMPKDDQEANFSGSPTGFTGRATSLTLPVGQIVREASVLAFRDLFTGGVQTVERIEAGERYAAVIRPTLRAFSYEYNRLKNAGFAITPTASVALEVSVNDASGSEVWRETLESGPVEGTAYVVTGNPGEEISKTAHKAILETLQRAAREAYEQLEGSSSAGIGRAAQGESL